MAVIEVNNLTKKHGELQALKGISSNVNEGEVFGLVTIFITVKLFKMDILLTRRVKSAEQKRRRGLFSLNLPSRPRRKN